MKTITTQQLKAKLEQGPLALFDVRGDIEYEAEHIPGAKTAPPGSLTFRVASIMRPESMVVVYAGDKRSLEARDAVERLEGLRMKNVHCYEEGLAGWKDAGFDVVESRSPRVHTRGPVVECRPLVVDRENAYGGAFRGNPVDVEGAGG